MNKLLTPKETAALLGIAMSSLYGMTSSKTIPFRKIGRLVRFDPDDIDRWTLGKFKMPKGKGK